MFTKQAFSAVVRKHLRCCISIIKQVEPARSRHPPECNLWTPGMHRCRCGEVWGGWGMTAKQIRFPKITLKKYPLLLRRRQ